MFQYAFLIAKGKGCPKSNALTKGNHFSSQIHSLIQMGPHSWKHGFHDEAWVPYGSMKLCPCAGRAKRAGGLPASPALKSEWKTEDD